MSNYSKIYWLTRLDYLQNFFIGIAAVIVAILFIYAFIYVLNEDWENIKKKYFAIWLPIVAFFTLLACLTPTRNEALVIIAGGATIDYAQSDTSLKKIPYQVTSTVSTYIDVQLEKLKKESNK